MSSTGSKGSKHSDEMKTVPRIKMLIHKKYFSKVKNKQAVHFIRIGINFIVKLID